MSGLAGLWFLDGRPVDEVAFDALVDRLTHRGPDGRGSWVERERALGHRLLFTTPESLHERQPVIEAGGQRVLVADARIDNRDELIAALGLTERTNRRPSEIPDSAILLWAYEKWEEEAPAQLIGDFAFALWDALKGRLFCARDLMGVKPLYYHHRPGHLFVCASEVKAILALQDVVPRLNEAQLYRLLNGDSEQETATLYQEIERLPAGHCLSLTTQGIRSWEYWSLDRKREIRLASDADYAEAFRELFTEAVRCRLRSAFPVASTLSGGLDSSSIVCTARQILREERRLPLKTISAVFPSLSEAELRRIDERPYMEAVLRQGDPGDLDGHFIEADRLSPLMDMEKALFHMDEAYLAPNFYLHWAFYKVAHGEGARVFLDGIDGDTTVSHGMGYLLELARGGRWRRLFREAKAVSEKSPGSFYTPARVAWMYGFEPAIPPQVFTSWRALKGCLKPRHSEESLLQPDFAERMSYLSTNTAQKTPFIARSERDEHWISMTSTLYGYALEMADKAAAAFSLEARYPFFDRRLMEFCLALPPEQKLSQGWSRMVLRRAMEGILPPEVQWRTNKANLSANLARNTLAYENARLEQLVESPGRLEEYVQLSQVRRLYEGYKQNPAQGAGSAWRLNFLVLLANWLNNDRLTAP